MRRGTTGRAPLAVAVLLFLSVAGYLALGDATEGETPSQEVVDPSGGTGGVPEDEPVARVAARVGPSAVQVNVGDASVGDGRGVGSGVIYREDGYVVTDNHVVEGADEVEVAFADGTSEEGEVVGTDPYTDLAVVRVDREGLPAAAFADGSELAAGQLAVAIGSPKGFQSTVTSGVISGVGRELPAQLTGGTALVDLIQTDAPISPGNSGGALADREGRVVGVNVAYVPPGAGAESIGFAIPSATVVSVADQIIESGRAVHPFLGVSLSDVTPEAADSFGVLGAEPGALVTEVEPGGPADDAGLETDDVIIAVGEEEIRGSGDLLSVLRAYEPGETAEITILRGGEERTVEARLGRREG